MRKYFHSGQNLHLIWVRMQQYVVPLSFYCIHHAGGLGFSSHEIGISLAIAGIFMLPFTLVVFPLVNSYLL